jgi:outer membrane usher protein
MSTIMGQESKKNMLEFKTKNSFFIFFASLIGIFFTDVVAQAREYYFAPELLQGSGLAAGLSRMNEKVIPIREGIYNIDLYVNGKLLKQNVPLRFIPSGKAGEALPCLSNLEIRLTELKPGPNFLLPQKDGCIAFNEISPESSWEFEQSTLRLNLIIPQAMLNRQPRGYIPVSEWDSGIPVLFLKHNSNYYETSNHGNSRTKNFWSGVTSGTNMGLWQLRNQSNLRYTVINNYAQKKWSSVKTYAQRPIPAINSVITVGDSYTNSSLFGSLSFNGLKLASDLKMFPQSRRGYAPEIRGVAGTTARVIVRQLGKTIYETIVSPGPFVINDLNNTRGQGDLQVTVIEANGQESTFTVLYSAISESVRPGVWNYELALGHVRNYINTDNEFMEGVIQKGISNSLTGNVGIRLAKDYQAYLMGGVMATAYGAFGLNTTYSHAMVENNTHQSGWRAEGSYSRTFTSGTNVSLAAYRYSTSGFRDLQDVLGIKRYMGQGQTYYSDTLKQKNQFTATISHGMGRYGSLSLNGSTADYYNNKSRITQLQFGYSNIYKNISYSVNIGRQRTTYSTRRYHYDVYESIDNSKAYTENTASFTLSVPLNWGKMRSSLSFNSAKNTTSDTSTASLSGSVGDLSNISYSLYRGIENYQDEGRTATWGGSLQNTTSKGTYRTLYSKGNGYRQFGLGTSGTLVVHSGGVTYGPYVSDTFALVKAKGAIGAAVKNGQGAKIDSLGYAILPSLTPYRYNSVTLDPKDMDPDVDLSGGSRQVVPYAGAVLGIEFETVSGKQVLINSALENGDPIPMGAEVTDRNEKSVGMVGQGSQIYARLGNQSGVLFVSWGKGKEERCHVNYQLMGGKIKEELIKMNLPCVKS